MTHVPTISAPVSTPGVTILFPDTEQSRRLCAHWEKQRIRRAETKRFLARGAGQQTTRNKQNTPSSVSPASDDGSTADPAMYTPTTNLQQQFDGCQSYAQHTIPITTIAPEAKISDSNEHTSNPSALNHHITSQIITGSSSVSRTTGKQAFNSCLAISDYENEFPLVYASKKNRSATAPALFDFISTNESKLQVPKNQVGSKLRTILSDFTTYACSNYKTCAYVNSELILCALSQMSTTGKSFYTQFKRGMSTH
jgi:hypothetical protein